MVVDAGRRWSISRPPRGRRQREGVLDTDSDRGASTSRAVHWFQEERALGYTSGTCHTVQQ